MSDAAVLAAVESSIAGLEDGGGGGEAETVAASTEQPTTESASADGTVAADGQQQTTDKPAGDPNTTADPALAADPQKGKRRGPIPFERHESILGNARAEGEKKLADLRKEYDTKLATATAHSEAMEVANADPERFLNALAQADPRYARILASVVGGGSKTAATANDTDLAAKMPPPDADGGYTPEGLRKLLDWHAEMVEARVAKRYAPMETEHRHRERISGAVTRINQQLQEAETWPGYKEHEAEILQTLRSDKRLNLESAYRKVVIPKFQANRDTMRAELLAEINGKPKKVTGTTPAAASVASNGARSVEDIVRESIAGL